MVRLAFAALAAASLLALATSTPLGHKTDSKSIDSGPCKYLHPGRGVYCEIQGDGVTLDLDDGLPECRKVEGEGNSMKWATHKFTCKKLGKGGSDNSDDGGEGVDGLGDHDGTKGDDGRGGDDASDDGKNDFDEGGNNTSSNAPAKPQTNQPVTGNGGDDQGDDVGEGGDGDKDDNKKKHALNGRGKATANQKGVDDGEDDGGEDNGDDGDENDYDEAGNDTSINGIEHGANAGGNKTADGTCFPGSSVVNLENGRTIKMSELLIGDRVSVGGGRYSEVFMFTHKLPSVRAEFLEITTASGRAIRLTAGHYLPVNSVYTDAADVSVGDSVELSDGSHSTVTFVGSVSDVGLYNPQTVSGTIVVDGVVASVYTKAVAPTVAHALLAPLRSMMFARLGLSVELDSGSDFAVGFAPSAGGTFVVA